MLNRTMRRLRENNCSIDGDAAEETQLEGSSSTLKTPAKKTVTPRKRSFKAGNGELEGEASANPKSTPRKRARKAKDKFAESAPDSEPALMASTALVKEEEEGDEAMD